jgi:hypothetical protein
MHSLFWFLIWLLLFGGVSTPVQLPIGGEQPSTDEVFLLDFGASTAAGNGVLTLTFADVVEDSRCPADVSCAWSGMVIVELAAAVEDEPAQTLHVGGMTDNRGLVIGPVPARKTPTVFTIGGYEVALLAVTPYPSKAATPPDKAEYQVQVLVHENTSSN